MSKGYFLDKWLKIAEFYQAQMSAIFEKHSINKLDLIQLKKVSIEDYEKWQQYLHKCDRVSKNICNVISNG